MTQPSVNTDTQVEENQGDKYCHYYFDCNIDYFQDIGHRLSHKSEKGEFLFFKEKGINNFARFQVVNGDTLQVSPSASIFNQIELKGDTIKGFVNGTIVIYTK